MAKMNQLHRIVLIVNKFAVKGKYVPAAELVDYIEEQMRTRFSDTAGCSLRTLQRDFKDIDTLFGITIRHMDGKGYYVADTKPQSDGYKSLLFNMEILGLMDSDSSISRYVLPEKCRPVINVDFSVFFDAIRESKYVKFNYTYFRYGNKVSAKMVRPVFLKESQNRWYLVGYDRKDDRLKCFAIERMDSLGLLPEKFVQYVNEIDVRALFNESYGIWNNHDDPVEEIILKYDALDGSFVKSLPLHTSQEILDDDESGITIRLRLRITNDFVMALLARSRSVEVIAPLHLRHRVRDVLKNAYERNL